MLVAFTLGCLALHDTAAAADLKPQGAARFLSKVVRQLAANDYTDAWQTLHPIDQALVPLDVYVACESASPVAGHIASIRAQSIGRAEVSLTLAGPVVPSYIVQFAVVIVGYEMPVGTHVTVRAHAILVGEQWRWMLPPARVRTYQSCAPR